MIKFSQFLRESVPTKPTNSKSEWADFKSKYDELVSLFNLGYSSSADVVRPDTAGHIKSLRQIFNLPDSPSKKLYRIFPQEGLSYALSPEDRPEFDKIKWGPQKPVIAFLKAHLEGHEANLKTGITNIQSWTGDPSYPARFHREVRYERFPYFVIVESVFDSSDILWGYPDFYAAHDIFVEWAKTYQKSSTDTSIAAGLAKYAKESKIMAEKTSGEAEFVVFTPIPRKVKVMEILNY
jgi:hypothetical protein